MPMYSKGGEVMKNKAVMVVLLFIMLLSLVGCNGGNGKPTESPTAIQGDTKTAVITESTKLQRTADLKDKRIGVLLGSIHDA